MYIYKNIPLQYIYIYNIMEILRKYPTYKLLMTFMLQGHALSRNSNSTTNELWGCLAAASGQPVAEHLSHKKRRFFLVQNP